MATGIIFTDGKFQGVGNNGQVVPYGQLYFTKCCTGQPSTTYRDSKLSSTNTHPIILSASGKADVFLTAGEYDVTLKDKNGVTVWTINSFIPTGGSGGDGGDSTLTQQWRENFAAVEGQKIFTATRDLTNVNLYINGTLLTPNIDYITNGVTATLTLGSELNDEISIIGGEPVTSEITLPNVVGQVDTIVADLPLVDKSIFSTVNVKGYNTINDGGGGTFIYDSSRSTENDGGTVFNGWVRQDIDKVTVKMFGAKGDATTNDTQAILNTIDYSKANSNNSNVYVPAGKYLIDGLELDSIRGVNIIGESAEDEVSTFGKTWFYWNNASSADHFIRIRSCAYMTFSGINFYSNSIENKKTMLNFECNDNTTSSPRNKFASTKVNFRGCSFVVSSGDTQIMTTATVHVKSALATEFTHCIFHGKTAIKLGQDTDVDPNTGGATIPDGRAVLTTVEKCTIRGDVAQERILIASFRDNYIRENSWKYDGSGQRVSIFYPTGAEEIRDFLLDGNKIDSFNVSNVGVTFYKGPENPPTNISPSLVAINNEFQGAVNIFIVSAGNVTIKNNSFIADQFAGGTIWNAITVNSNVDSIDIKNNNFKGWTAINTTSVIANVLMDNRNTIETRDFLLSRSLLVSFSLSNNNYTDVLSRTVDNIEGGKYIASYQVGINSQIDTTFTARLTIDGTVIDGTAQRFTTNTASNKLFTVQLSPRIVTIPTSLITPSSVIKLQIQQATGATYASIKGDDYDQLNSHALIHKAF